jgi:hypothetical protein
MSDLIVRVGGASAALAGALIVAQEIWDVVIAGTGEGVVESAVHTTWVLLLVFGLLGLHLRQHQAGGWFGQLAALVAMFGTVTLFAGALVEVTVLPALPPDSPLIEAPPPALGIMMLVSFAAYIVGLLLFGIASWRARVLPRWTGALLVIGIVLALALKPLLPGALAVFGVAWICLGAAAVRQTRTTVEVVEPVVLART